MAQLTRSTEELVRRAGELAVEYEAEFKGCTQTTFLAIADTLRWGGLEIISPDAVDELFPGISLLSAGIAITGEGSCGAVTGATLAIGLALAKARGVQGRDMTTMGDSCAIVRREVLDKFYDTYNSQRCMDIQLKRFGKAWDFRIPEMSDEFLAITDGCAIKDTAQSVVAAIANELR